MTAIVPSTRLFSIAPSSPGCSALTRAASSGSIPLWFALSLSTVHGPPFSCLVHSAAIDASAPSCQLHLNYPTYPPYNPPNSPPTISPQPDPPAPPRPSTRSSRAAASRGSPRCPRSCDRLRSRGSARRTGSRGPAGTTRAPLCRSRRRSRGACRRARRRLRCRGWWGTRRGRLGAREGWVRWLSGCSLRRRGRRGLGWMGRQ